VAPGFRRTGVARALIMEGEAKAKAAGLPRVHVGVRLVLLGNRRLFASLGFCETHTHAHEGFDHPTWVEMEKKLV
jgi:predicted N-acetyltransferase YhbS